MFENKTILINIRKIHSLSSLLSVIIILSLLSNVFVVCAESERCLDRIDTSSSNTNNHNRSVANLCKCPPDKPVRLSPEIPCQRLKALGEVCLHSSECDGPQSACIAALLYPVELHSIPNYRSWYIYNQITGSDDLNYLLNKVYGQCRCRTGFRSSSNRTCLARDKAQTKFNCSMKDFPDPCTSLVQYSRCMSGVCQCEKGRLFNSHTERCYSIAAAYHGQFCVTSVDCQSSNDTDHPLHCSKGRCSCPLGFRFSSNASACVSLRRCDLGFFWNRTTARCEPLSEMSLFYNSLLLKIFLLLLVNLFVLNLIRYACYARFFQAREVALPFRTDDELESTLRNRSSRHHLHHHQRSHHHHHHRSSSNHSQLCRAGRCAQSQSLLSLPPYDLLYNPANNGEHRVGDEPSTPTSSTSLAPPSYDEAMRAKALDCTESVGVDGGLSCTVLPMTNTDSTTMNNSTTMVSLYNHHSSTTSNSSNSVHSSASYTILKDSEDDAEDDRSRSSHSSGTVSHSGLDNAPSNATATTTTVSDSVGTASTQNNSQTFLERQAP